MKFGSTGFGYTRDFAEPHRDDKDDPRKGIMAEFYERSYHKHNERGQLLYLAETGAETVNETPKPVMTHPVLMVRFHTTGDPKCSLAVRKANEIDKRDFKQSFEAFKQGKSFLEGQGTALENLRDFDIMAKATLNALNIYSIEQLSETPENIVMANPGLRNWVNKAREYRILNKPKPNQEVMDELAAVKAELAALRAAKPKLTVNKDASL